MERDHYPSDLTEAQCKVIEPLLPPAKRRGPPREIDRLEVVNAILYVLRTGCQWRQLPHDFPHWKTVYNLFWQWRNDGTWQRIHDALRDRVRQAEGRTPSPSAGLIDSQTVKTTEVGGLRGYDGGKTITGRKRHLAVDTRGLILAVVVHPADWQDYDGACVVLSRLTDRFQRLKVLFADAIYGKAGLPEWVQETFGWILEIVKRSADTRGFVPLPKRWIGERTFAWLGRYRRHSKDYERSNESSEAMIYISMIHLMVKRLARAP